VIESLYADVLRQKVAELRGKPEHKMADNNKLIRLKVPHTVIDF